MPAITSANVATAIVKLIAARAVPALMGELIMGGLVTRDFEQTLASAGDTVNVPIPPVMVANDLAEGGSVQTQNPTPGNAQIVLNSHKEATFKVPDIVAALTGADKGNFGLLDLYMNPAITAIAETIETDLLSLATNFTVNSPVGTYNTSLLESVIDAADTAMFNAKVPANMKRALVLSGNAYGDVRQLDRFTEEATVGDGNAIKTGRLGVIKGFDVYRSQFVNVASGTNTNNLAFAPPALGLALRRLPKVIPGTGAIVEYAELGGYGMRITMSYDANTKAQQFSVDVLYGVGVLRNTHGVLVKS